jgi:hypothetical protein
LIPALQVAQSSFFDDDAPEKELKCIYVGQTNRSVMGRLTEHAKTGTPLGEWLCSVVLPTHYALRVVSCDYSGPTDITLDHIERTLIARWRPALNIVQYHSDDPALALPEIESLCADVNQMFVYGMKLPIYVPLTPGAMAVHRAGTLTGQDREELLGSLYDRAYRDPGRPKE